MQPKRSSHRIVDLRFRSRHAASNERLVGILCSCYPLTLPGIAKPETHCHHPHLSSVLYGSIQRVHGRPMLGAGAPIGSLYTASRPLPIPCLHIRLEADRILQAVVGPDRFVPIVHQAIQRFVGTGLRYAQSPCTVRAGNHARPSADKKNQRPVGRWGSSAESSPESGRTHMSIPCCMPPMPWAPGLAPSFSSTSSATIASVVSSRPATEAAFCSAVRATLVGSTTPISTRSP